MKFWIFSSARLFVTKYLAAFRKKLNKVDKVYVSEQCMNPENNISININFRRLIFFMGVMFRVLFIQFQFNLFNFQFNVHKDISNTKKNLLGKADWLI